MKIFIGIIAITVLVMGVIAFNPQLWNLSIPSPVVQKKSAESSSTVPVVKSTADPNDTGAPLGFRGPSGPPPNY